MRNNLKDQLLLAARSRGVRLLPEDVKSICRGHDIAEEHARQIEVLVDRQHLLSTEEVEASQHGSAQGNTRRPEFHVEGCTVQPFLEGEIADAITLLDSSTAFVEKQSANLKKQRDLLEALVDRNLELAQARHASRAVLRRRQALEIQHLTFAIEESSQELATKFDVAEDIMLRTAESLIPSFTALLNGDDRTLQVLASSSASLGLPQTGEERVVHTTTKLIDKLLDFSREEIQCRLDRIYLEQSARSDEPRNGVIGQSTGEEKRVADDLRSLYSEISDVVTLSVSQEFKRPILDAIDHGHNALQLAVYRNFELTSEALLHLTQHLESSTRDLWSFQSHRETLRALGSIWRDLMENATNGSTAQVVSGIEQDEGVPDAYAAMMRHFGMTMQRESDVRAERECLLNKRESLHEALRQQKVTGIHQLEASLAPAELASELLHETLSSERNGDPLVSGGFSLQEDLVAMDKRIRQIGDEIEKIDMRGVGEYKHKQAAFLRKWS